MEWHVLALVLSMISSIRADCSTQCLICAQQTANSEMSINSLTCTLECEGTLASTAELDKCEKALELYSPGQPGVSDRNEQPPSTPETGDQQETAIGNVVKRYGGFIKRIDKNKKVNPLSRENAYTKSMFAKKYGNSLRKFWERDIPELLVDTQRGDGSSENEVAVYDDDRAINEMKRYGGFLRKFGPKRSNSGEEDGQEELQKRYGGFMRRIRPKLKWDNQKRYGGFLRRHFKVSIRSEEEPSSYESFDR
ncbi:hypothetical protein COCON_G00148320 [Conger conger]|uniref:Proenkephalin-B n=1 Tax=Conger conger TaxID=82655 RepID=A0A9Q1DC42_CONCO|nr:proenkephalin-B-like [Conger conger]KAJ8265733.1 hypothetical protein COCON_G00148320 [Conger conger]